MANILEKRPYQASLVSDFLGSKLKNVSWLEPSRKAFFQRICKIGLSYLSKTGSLLFCNYFRKIQLCCVKYWQSRIFCFVQVFPTYLCITDVSLAPLGVIHCVQYTCTHTLLGIVVDSITFTLLNNKYRVIRIFCIHINGIFK